MAKMIPEKLIDTKMTSSEKFIFQKFQSDDTCKNWTIIFGCHLKNHITQKCGEIDFIILAPKLGICCLEVKGGEVVLENGVWSYSDGRSDSRGPFKQAEEAMFSLKRLICEKDNRDNDYYEVPFSYGVVFPYSTFDTRDNIQFDSWRVLDASKKEMKIGNYVEKVIKESNKGFHKSEFKRMVDDGKSTEIIEEIKKILFKDIKSTLDYSVIAEGTELAINQHTQEQVALLHLFEKNERVLIEGAAGTGKSLMAIEAANKSVSKGERTLVLCYNRLLADYLRRRIVHKDKDKIMIRSFHGFLENITGISHKNYKEILRLKEEIEKNTSNTEELKKLSVALKELQQEFYKSILIDKGLEYIEAGEFEKYDMLIVDEGQDLLCDEYILILDSVIKGGLKSGRWMIFGDFKNQAVFNNEKPVLENLNKLCNNNYTNVSLSYNCRNPLVVAKELKSLFKIEEDEYFKYAIEGAKVEYIQYSDVSDKVNKVLAVIDKLKKARVKESEITILSCKKDKDSFFNNISDKKYNIIDIAEENNRNLAFESECIKFSFSSAYKGLENRYIIVTDVVINKSIDEIQEQNFGMDFHLSNLYVAMSRAKVGLYIIVNEENMKKINALKGLG